MLQKKTKVTILGSALAACLAVALLVPFLLGAFPKKEAEKRTKTTTRKRENPLIHFFAMILFPFCLVEGDDSMPYIEFLF